MSLVGPRPLRPFEVAFLAPWQRARQELRPGLTGLWQVMGRSDVDWDERMQLDYTLRLPLVPRRRTSGSWPGRSRRS